MLNKLLKTRKPEERHSGHDPPVPGPLHEEENSAALKIVHVGGIMEWYYMAIPAKRIMDKYPLFYLTRPDFFRRPWESLIRPDQILLPGQRFFVVPRHTVRKIRRRVRKPTIKDFVGGSSFGSFVSESVNDASMNGGCVIRPSCGKKKHVRFVGLEEKPHKGPLSVEQKVRSSIWEPSLASITEKHGPNE